jgi:AraC family transcriptional regulator, regulatory protein of adaptative response / methylated-DNA-[protein]-cysteine methyltransferase
VTRKQGNGQAAGPDQVRVVRDLCQYIEAHRDQPLTLAGLGRHAGLSPAHVQRVFKRVTGISPRQYADACRLGHLKSILKERENVTAALYEAGFGSSSRLYERAPGQLGMTPGTYRKGGRATVIRYTTTRCPLGRVLLAATQRGICSVRLGDSDARLEADLIAEYPAAEIQRDDVQLRSWVDELLAHLNGRCPHLELPLDVQATAFQWRIWQELCAIPYGSTRSYSQIAQAVGRPKAVRAVARACATNPAAVIIPCHRAVREDGGLGGYRWGLERKKKLLAQERRLALKDKNQK